MKNSISSYWTFCFLLILISVGTHFKVDLMDRKAEVKRIIEDVINSMSDEDEDEDGEDEPKEN